MIDFVIPFKIHRLCLPPATKLRQGNVFTPVCHSVHRGGLPHTHTHTHPGRHPPTPGQTPPCAVHAGIRLSSGWYASYWNAFLSEVNFKRQIHEIPFFQLGNLNVDDLARQLDDVVKPMQKHFSYKPGAYYNHALFFLSIAIHKVCYKHMFRDILKHFFHYILYLNQIVNLFSLGHAKGYSQSYNVRC